MDSEPPNKKRGFAAMDKEKQRELASKGGRAAHRKGTAHKFTSEEGKLAGQKGGATVSQDRQHMAEIGRLGGKAFGKKRQEKLEELDENLTESK